MKKILIASGIISIILGLLLIGFFIVGPYLFKTKDYIVPNLYGLTLDEAYNTIGNNLEINVENVLGKLDDKIIDSNPKANSIVKEKSKITLYLSSDITFMPKITDKYYEDIKDDLDDIRNKYQNEVVIIEEIDNNLPINYVKRQIPEENSILDKNTSIIIYVIKHDNIIVLPNMVGWDINDAKNFASKNGLIFQYNYDYSFDFDENIVIGQSAMGGTEIIKNGKNFITLTISKPLSEIPDFSGYDIEVALLLAPYFNLDVDIVYVNSNEEKNIILKQEVYASTIKKICLYVSS